MGSFGGGRSPLQEALGRGLAPGGDPAGELDALGETVIETEGDARALAEAVARLAPGLAKGEGRGPALRDRLTSLLHRLVELFQSVQNRETYEILRAEGVSHLLSVFDARLRVADEDEATDLLFLLKVAAMYRVEASVDRVAAAARSAMTSEGALWTVIFRAFDENHPYRIALLNRLRNPLPGGFAGAAYLDFANAIAREGGLANHPYNTPDGRARLRAWLTDPAPKNAGYAHVATAALPFIDRPERDDLLALAMDHPEPQVQLEAAWAAGRLGSEAALKFLARSCLDHRHGKAAAAYLTELGHGGRIPAAALDPNFQAVAEMSRWLAHPSEFGRPPDEIAVADTRELFWPPTNDRRRLWVVRYRYAPARDGDRPEAGYGLVGSVTFALFGESTADLPPEDVYALHCCWELEMNGDPRAPKDRSVAAGRAILRGGAPSASSDNQGNGVSG